jgi:hypothetical protein
MTLLNRHMMVGIAILSTTSIVRPAEIIGCTGQALIPFCAGVFRGADAYQKGQKVETSVIAKEDAIVSSITTVAHVMSLVPGFSRYSEGAKLKGGSLQEKEELVMSSPFFSRFYVAENGFQVSPEFSTKKGAEELMGEMRSSASKILKTAPMKLAKYVGIQICAFPAGYAVGYHAMKLWNKRHERPVAPEKNATKK